MALNYIKCHLKLSPNVVSANSLMSQTLSCFVQFMNVAMEIVTDLITSGSVQTLAKRGGNLLLKKNVLIFMSTNTKVLSDLP